MKRSVKQLSPQMNLPLDNVPHAENPEEQCEDLTAALMELLISAAEEKHEQPGNGGEMNPKLTPERLSRKAIVYVRQSKPSQLIHNQESTRLQLSLADRARALGFNASSWWTKIWDEQVRVWSIAPVFNAWSRKD